MHSRTRTAGLALILLAGCSDGGPRTPEEELVRRGRAAYQTDCVVCHNPDPREPGAVGPALAGSSLELLRAKVLHNAYPPGYTPKRDTQAMIPLVHREPDLPALEAYLASFPR